MSSGENEKSKWCSFKTNCGKNHKRGTMLLCLHNAIGLNGDQNSKRHCHADSSDSTTTRASQDVGK